MGYHCPECAAILREMRAAPGIDVGTLREEWLATGRDLKELRKTWLDSIANQDSVEPIATCDPKTMEAHRKRLEHEALTGHSILKHGWRGQIGL